MIKSELIIRVSQGLENVVPNVVERVLDEALSLIGKQLKIGDSVKIAGFGVFYAKERKARLVRNPQTGEKMKVGASVCPKFRAGKKLKEIVNK